MPEKRSETTDRSGYTVEIHNVYDRRYPLSLATTHHGNKIIQSADNAAATGFKIIYQSDMDESVAKRRDKSEAAAVLTLKSAMEPMGGSQEFCHIAVASSILWDEKYLPEILEEAGLSRLNKSQIEKYGLACNSVRALQRVLKNEIKSAEARVPTIVFTLDDLTGRVESIEGTDDQSRYIFSNGFAALGLIPGESLSHIKGTPLITLPDTNGALCARVEYPKLKGKVGEIVEWENGESIIMHDTNNDLVWIFMGGGATAKLFIRIAENLSDYFSKKEMADVDHWVAHQPSIMVYKALQRRYPEMRLKWQGVKGNSSGTTTFMAMAEQMKDFEPGQTLGFFGFGAGATLTGEIAKLGPNGK